MSKRPSSFFSTVLRIVGLVVLIGVVITDARLHRKGKLDKTIQ